MKFGIPGQVTAVGQPGQRGSTSLGHRGVSTTEGHDRPDDESYGRPGNTQGYHSAAEGEAPTVPTAGPPAFRTGTPNAGAVDTLLDELADIRLILQEVMPRSAIGALQREINQLGERADNCRRERVDGATVAAIQRQLAEIREALRTLRPAESLLGMARVLRQLSRKITMIGGAGDAVVLEQVEIAVVAMRNIVSHAASRAALVKLSEEVRALGAQLDDARSRADSRIFSALETRIAMLADQLQARDRSGPNVPDELKALIERLINRIELAAESFTAPARLEHLIAKLAEKLDACDAGLDQLATIEATLAELFIHIERRHAPALGRDTPPAVEALWRDVAYLRKTEKQTQDSLEVAHGTLAHVVDRLAMIETDMRGAPPHSPNALTPASAGESPSAISEAPKPPSPLDETSAPATPPATEHYTTDTHILPDRPLKPGSRETQDLDPDLSGERVIAPETAVPSPKPPSIEDCGGTSTFIAAARRAAQVASRSALMENGAAQVVSAPDDRPARQFGKLGALIGGMIIITVLGGLQVMGLLPDFSGEVEMNTTPRPAATSNEDIVPPSMPSFAGVPASASEDPRGFPVLSPVRPQLDIFRYVDGATITTRTTGQVAPGWTLEQLLEAQMTSDRWDDATSGVTATASAPARRKRPVVGPMLDLGSSRHAQ
jgi:localization factor PodJL